MDEREFKTTYRKVNERPCAFAKAVLRRCCGCSRAQRVYLAEREAVACKSPGGQERCKALLEQLRPKAIFALHIPQFEGVLPHAKEVKVQCGSMQGLSRTLEQAEAVDDIHALLDQAESRYGDLDSLPFSEMMQSISHFKVRGN